MNRGDMVDIIHKGTNCSRVDAEKAIDNLGLEIREALCRDEDVRWTHLLNLKVGTTKESTRRNPQTNEQIVVPSKKRIYVKIAKALKDAVNL